MGWVPWNTIIGSSPSVFSMMGSYGVAMQFAAGAIILAAAHRISR